MSSASFNLTDENTEYYILYNCPTINNADYSLTNLAGLALERTKSSILESIDECSNNNNSNNNYLNSTITDSNEVTNSQQGEYTIKNGDGLFNFDQIVNKSASYDLSLKLDETIQTESSFDLSKIIKNTSESTNLAKISGDVRKLDPRPKRRVRTRFSQSQLDTLEKIFNKETQYPDANLIDSIGEMIGLSFQTITVWFQNRRAKSKRNNSMKKTNKTEKSNE